MKLASTIHTNSIHIPSNIDSNLLKASPFTCPKNVRVRFISRSFHSLFSGGCVCHRKYYHSAPVFLRTAPTGRAKSGSPIAHNYSTVASARRTEREQEESASTKEATKYQSLDGVNNNDNSCEDTSSTNSGEVTSETAEYTSSLRIVGLCLVSAVAFGVGVGFVEGLGRATEFFAGYLLEQCLSVDNLFVFVLIFKYFKVPFGYQNRVLTYGIAGAIVFRLSLILLGSATLERFEVVNLLLAAVLLYSSFKLFAEEEEESDLSDNFIVKICQKFIPVTPNYDGNQFFTKEDDSWKATPLLLTVAVIELSDIAFAVDSIPAVFGVTKDPFIVFTSNLFAILGLRSYYTLIAESMADLEYLQPAIGAILGFIGCKMILDFFGFHVSTEVSLGVVFASLMGGVLLSIIKKSTTKS